MVDVEKQAYPVDELEVGMYVSALDRPWIETPFLFQGFLIENPGVIDEIKAHCRFVYVDVERGDDSLVIRRPDAVTIDRTGRNSNSREAPQRIARQGPATDSSPLANDESIDDTVSLKAELELARGAHDSAEQAVQALMRRVRSGDEIDVAALQRAVDPMIDSIARNEDAMSWLARMKRKQDYIYDHSIASAIWAMIFGKHLGLSRDDLHILGTGAIFLDVGKTRIPNDLLTKRGTLNAEEFSIMKDHVRIGLDIVRKISGIDPRVTQMVAGHHERYNGTGYPLGLSGSDIPAFARIAGIVDAYDAMTTPRPYAAPISTHVAVSQLNKLAGVEFPEEVVEQFVQAIGVFPVGSLIELNTGEIGVVVAQNRVRRLRPKVMIITDRDKAPTQKFRIVDLRNQLADASDNTSLWIESGLPPGAYGLDPSEYYL